MVPHAVTVLERDFRVGVVDCGCCLRCTELISLQHVSFLIILAIVQVNL